MSNGRPAALVERLVAQVRHHLPAELTDAELNAFLRDRYGTLLTMARRALPAARGQAVPVPWRAGELRGPSGEAVGRFDEAKAAATGRRWSRSAPDLPEGFAPLPAFDDYALIAVQVSGGKDSVAAVAALHRLIGTMPHLWARVELWHQDVDGGGAPFMDWPVTRAYVAALGVLFDAPVRVACREGGFERELLRDHGEARGPKIEETPWGPRPIGRGSIERPDGPARRRFPALTPDLRYRWCSGELKIDVARTLAGAAASEGSPSILLVTGERAAESAPRARYTRGRDAGSSGRRQIHQLRLVLDHADAEVWEELRLGAPGRVRGIQPHPAYEMGWSRCSCAGCIFSSRADLRRLQEALPAQFARIASVEERLVADAERAHPHLVAERARLIEERAVLTRQAQRARDLPPVGRAELALVRTRLDEIAGTLGRTIVRGGTLRERAAQVELDVPAAFTRWRLYADGTLPWTAAHMLRGPGAPFFPEPWSLPPGALNENSSGPPT